MALVDPVAAAGAEVRGPPVAVAVLGVMPAPATRRGCSTCALVSLRLRVYYPLISKAPPVLSCPRHPSSRTSLPACWRRTRPAAWQTSSRGPPARSVARHRTQLDGTLGTPRARAALPHLLRVLKTHTHTVSARPRIHILIPPPRPEIEVTAFPRRGRLLWRGHQRLGT
jgi:hypothetical protein